MFRRLRDAYDRLASAIHNYADAWDAATQRVNALHGPDAESGVTLLPAAESSPPEAAETAETSTPTPATQTTRRGKR